MLKNEFKETKKLLKKITIELAEIQKMLNELQNVTKRKENLEKLMKRRTLYIQ